ncbi:hypothetical protein [Cesiribacter sp. SM1]|uniref:hypothetical protein n=1 Tax=Cesiribacter sp. SM1 TaxID=2861196 RepID=UPI001CD75345|nr:hypothetical protein [Cesiribacter sp. SM1]
MNQLFLVVICILVCSCCGLHTEVEYQYEDVTVTRIDECGITSFYYKNAENQSAGKIWVEYSGINDGFSGYLQFSGDGKVSLLSGDGHFQGVNLDANFDYKRILSYERPQLGEQVYYISSSISFEKEKNSIGKTMVEAKYKIDDNEWW